MLTDDCSDIVIEQWSVSTSTILLSDNAQVEFCISAFELQCLHSGVMAEDWIFDLS